MSKSKTRGEECKCREHAKLAQIVAKNKVDSDKPEHQGGTQEAPADSTPPPMPYWAQPSFENKLRKDIW